MGGQLVKPYVFISYKSEEYDIANRVRTEMEQSGVPCWMAPESIPGGSSYAEEIPAAIQGCGAFVLILTKKSQNSKWIKRELDIAISKDKLIMPFVPRKINFNNEMSFYLNNVQHFFAYENQDRVLENMINQICDELGIQRQYPQLEKEVSRKSGSVRKKAWIPRLNNENAADCFVNPCGGSGYWIFNRIQCLFFQHCKYLWETSDQKQLNS